VVVNRLVSVDREAVLAPDQIQALRRELRAWYAAGRRQLPWREDPRPYRVWVSEIMLQQTQVATVVPYFERFMAAFPDVQRLATAEETEVLARWAGLGYYRRARLLHRAAREVVSQHGGRVPSTVDELLALPGIGRYTAGAIASIAHGLPASVLDGNVQRVLARLVALEEPANGTRGRRLLWELADRLLDPEDPGAHNQALMELGARVCTQQRPDCGGCPIAGHCAARRAGSVGSFPRKLPRRPPTPILGACALWRGGEGRILLARRPPNGLLGGLWELPGGEGPEANGELLSRALRERLGVAAAIGRPLASVEHAFTHRRLTLTVYEASALQEPSVIDFYTSIAWWNPAIPPGPPLSRLTEKVLEAVGMAHG
jgi:A/G-specific adenine glycosylase